MCVCLVDGAKFANSGQARLYTWGVFYNVYDCGKGSKEP